MDSPNDSQAQPAPSGIKRFSSAPSRTVPGLNAGGSLVAAATSLKDDHIKSLSNAAAFCKTSSVHGLRFWPAYPGQPRFWICVQFGWILLTLASLAAVTYFSYDAVDKYLQYRTTTHYDIQRAPDLPFPAVTVCNFNTLRYSAILDGLGESSVITKLPNLYLLCSLYALEEDFCDAQSIKDSIKADNRTLGEIYATLGHQREQLIPNVGRPTWRKAGCTYAGQPCSNANFTRVFSEYGNCYTFNGEVGAQLVSRSQGQKSGLEVILNVEQHEYFSRGTTAVGLAVFIHPPHRPLLAYHGALALTPGTENFVAIRARKTVREPKPYNGPSFCTTRAEGQGIVDYYSEYSLAACKKECAARFVFARCKCRMPEMPALEVDGVVPRGCSLNEAEKCGEPQRDLFESNYTAQQEYCSKCGEPCNEIGYQYSYRLSSSNFLDASNALNMELALSELNIYLNSYSPLTINSTAEEYKQRSFIDARENLIKLIVYFDDLNYEVRKEIPVYPLVSMIGDLGGNLGLFLGASLLTVVEVIQFILVYTQQKTVGTLKKRSGSYLKRREGRRELVNWDTPASSDANNGSREAQDRQQHYLENTA